MHNQLLQSIKKQKDNPLPTPPIGASINWFEQNKEGLCYAAIVTGIQGPGKLEITVFKPRHFPIHKQGVLHRSHPAHEGRSNPATIASGSWDYLPLEKAHKAHFQLHLEHLEKREDAILEEERRRQEHEKAKAEINKQADKEAAAQQK